MLEDNGKNSLFNFHSVFATFLICILKCILNYILTAENSKNKCIGGGVVGKFGRENGLQKRVFGIL